MSGKGAVLLAVVRAVVVAPIGRDLAVTAIVLAVLGHGTCFLRERRRTRQVSNRPAAFDRLLDTADASVGTAVFRPMHDEMGREPWTVGPADAVNQMRRAASPEVAPAIPRPHSG